jgi:hypothetical protein
MAVTGLDLYRPRENSLDFSLGFLQLRWKGQLGAGNPKLIAGRPQPTLSTFPGGEETDAPEENQRLSSFSLES